MDIMSIAVYLLHKGYVTSHLLFELFAHRASDGTKKTWVPEEVSQFAFRVRELRKEGRILPKTEAFLLNYPLWEHKAISYQKYLHKHGIDTYLQDDAIYPQEFRMIGDPPFILFCTGNKELLQTNYKLAMVGTRQPSKHGEEKSKQFAFESAYCKITTVAGNAVGVDSLIHQYSQKYGGDTVAFVPRLDIDLNPKKSILYVSEFPPNSSQLEKWMFIARNRLVAAFSDATVVIEAPIKSGTLTTVDLAVSYGRNVYFVLPDITCESALGGMLYAIANPYNSFVQSLYDVLFWEEQSELVDRYTSMITSLSGGQLFIPEKEYRHLALVNLLPILWRFANKDLRKFETLVVKLQRSGIIVKRKNKAVFNFSGYNSWQKT